MAGLWVVDRGTNGTFVNGESIREKQLTMRPGDRPELDHFSLLGASVGLAR